MLAGRRRARTRAAASLAGAKVLVTAGGTREPIDSVRFIGNNSSGRMGLALAGAARRRGARGGAAVRQRGPAGARRGRRVPTSSSAAAAAGGLRARVPLLRRAADGRRGGRLRAACTPARARSRRAAATACRWSWRRPPTSSPGSPGAAATGRRSSGFAAEHGAEAVAGAQAKLAAKHARRAGRQRHLARGHRLRLGLQRGHDPDAPEGTLASSAGDVPGPQGGGRRGDPRRRRTAQEQGKGLAAPPAGG